MALGWKHVTKGLEVSALPTMNHTIQEPLPSSRMIRKPEGKGQGI